MNRQCEACGKVLRHARRGRQPRWCDNNCRRRAVYAGTCQGCGGRTYNATPRPPDYCARCTPGQIRKWTRETVIAAIRRWDDEFGAPPTAADWNATMARKAGRPPRPAGYPATNVAQAVFGSWNDAISAAGFTPLGAGDRRTR